MRGASHIRAVTAVAVLGFLAAAAPAAADSVTVAGPSSIARGVDTTVHIQGTASSSAGDLDVQVILRGAARGPCAPGFFGDASMSDPDWVAEMSTDAPSGSFDIPFDIPADNTQNHELGAYDFCVWVSDALGPDVEATAQVPVNLVAPALTLKVTPPSHARAGQRGTFTASGSAQAPAGLSLYVVSTRIAFYVHHRLHHKAVHGCPANYAAMSLMAQTSEGVFEVDTGDRPVTGTFRRRAHLMATSAGSFFLCGYELDDSSANSRAEVDASARFRVAKRHSSRHRHHSHRR